ncbi:hypothetical protein JCM11641_005586 [Rhodosporidiobolus odoratus]
MGLIWTDSLPGAGSSKPSPPKDSLAPTVFKYLKAAGVGPEKGSRLLGMRTVKKRTEAHIEMDRDYNGKDGYRHHRHLDATLGNDHVDSKALFYNPKADLEHKLALLDVHHDHKFGSLKLTDKRLNRLPPPQPTLPIHITPEMLAGLLAKAGIGKDLSKVAINIEIHATVVATLKQTKEAYLAVLCSDLPSTKPITRDPSLSDRWVVAPKKDDGVRRLVLLYKLTSELTVQVHFEVQIKVTKLS